MREKVNILMVDDQEGKLLSYEAILADLAENLLRARSGMEAFEQLLKHDIALILMDVNMPGMDGFETANMIHAHPRFENIPIIFISGIHLTDFDRLKGYEHGALDYVAVPIVPELLRAKVKVFAELHRKTRQLELLNARLVDLQEQERKRIARELHDSVGQLLAALSMDCARLHSEAGQPNERMAATLADMEELIKDALNQTRTISHLLHPPLLDEAGLASALRCYVRGFSERSHIITTLVVPDKFSGLSPEIELTIFRVIQECLTNIHRHACSPEARIEVIQDEHGVTIGIQDFGRGFPGNIETDPALRIDAGIGLTGMRERLRQLGGSLTIASNHGGTRVTATIPATDETALLRRENSTQAAEAESSR